MTDEYRPRISIDVTEEQRLALQKYVPWGTQNALFGALIDQLIPLLEKHGDTIIAFILNNKITAETLLQKAGEPHGFVIGSKKIDLSDD